MSTRSKESSGKPFSVNVFYPPKTQEMYNVIPSSFEIIYLLWGDESEGKKEKKKKSPSSKYWLFETSEKTTGMVHVLSFFDHVLFWCCRWTGGCSHIKRWHHVPPVEVLVIVFLPLCTILDFLLSWTLDFICLSMSHHCSPKAQKIWGFLRNTNLRCLFFHNSNVSEGGNKIYLRWMSTKKKQQNIFCLSNKAWGG